jgi:imidazole glycerol-phosphate synthase subunit HisH
MDAVLIDAGTGNLHSVHNALMTLGYEVRVSSDPADLARPARVILPGVGAFGRFMEGLQQRELTQAICLSARRGDPMLGICVGMQAFFEISAEMGTFAGLGLLPGQVVRFTETPGLKIPHTGWNQIWPQRPSALLKGIQPGEYAYFNHSYYCAPSDAQDVLAATDYGQMFASIVERGSLSAVQFHPEKSQQVGMQILRNFMSL